MQKVSLLIFSLLICSPAFADKVIIHSATRVIKVVTNNPSPDIPVNHEAVDVPNGFDLAGGPWKLDLDNVSKIAPTQQELKDAYRTQGNIDRDNLRAKMTALQANAVLSQDVKDFVQALKELLLLDEEDPLPILS